MPKKMCVAETAGNCGFRGGLGTSFATYEAIKQSEIWYGVLIDVDPAPERASVITEIRKEIADIVGTDVEVCVDGSRLALAGTFSFDMRNRIAQYCNGRPEIVHYQQLQGSYYDLIHPDWVERLPRRIAGQRR